MGSISQEVLYLKKIRTTVMITFQQYIGFIIFAVIATAGFWMLIFLLSILPYWIFGYLKDLRDQKKAAAKEDDKAIL